MSDVRFGVAFDRVISCAIQLLPHGLDPCFDSAGVMVSRGGARRRGWLRHDRFAVVFRPELRSKGEYNFTVSNIHFSTAGVTSCRAKRIKEKKERKEAATQRTDYPQPFLYLKGWL
jgi:hypothetical protein